MPPNKPRKGAANAQELRLSRSISPAMDWLCKIRLNLFLSRLIILNSALSLPHPNRAVRVRWQTVTLIFSAVLWLSATPLSAQIAPETQSAAVPQVDQQTHPSASVDDQSPDDTSVKNHALSPWQLLTTTAASRNPTHRREAIAALGTIGSQRRVLRLLEQALSDKDSSVRQQAAGTLGDLRARRSIPRLKQALNDDSPEVSFAAARSLWLMGDRTGREVFLQVLSGDKPASDGVLKNGFEATKKKLKDPKKLAILGAKEAADSLFGPAGWGIKVIEHVIQDRSASARAMSAILLGPDATADALKQLREALSDQSWIVRAAAAQALGASRRREQIQHLRPLLRDDKNAVRCLAAASIVRLSAIQSGSTAESAKSAAPDPRPALDPSPQNAFR